MRRGFRRLLEDDPAIAVVGEASNGDEAVRMVAGVEAGRRGDGLRDAGHRAGWPRRARFSARDPATQILMLSMHSEETLVRQALEPARAATS